jgi:hypothetical protein
MNRRFFFVAVPLAALFTLLTSAVSMSVSATDGSEAFTTPSKNIQCIYYSDFVDGKPWLECLVLEFGGKAPRKPADCDLDWSPQASLGRTGKAEIFACRGDTSLQQFPPVLKYGAVWKRGPYVCSVAQSGVTCRNGSKRGFYVSRSSIKAL